MKLLCIIFSALSLSCFLTIKSSTAMNYEVIIVIGTDRQESLSGIVANILYESYIKNGISTYIFDAGSMMHSDIYSPQAYRDTPTYFKEFNALLLNAPLIILVTPEYNATLPAPLTRIINLLSYPESFTHKKYSIVSVSVSPYGGIRAHEQLKKILIDLHAHVTDDLNLVIGNGTKNVFHSDMIEAHTKKVFDFLHSHK